MIDTKDRSGREGRGGRGASPDGCSGRQISLLCHFTHHDSSRLIKAIFLRLKQDRCHTCVWWRTSTVMFVAYAQEVKLIYCVGIEVTTVVFLSRSPYIALSSESRKFVNGCMSPQF